jgi:conjugative relaxase-like TrwC/TraI family protein
MLSIGTVSSAAAASGYFNRDDYYTRGADVPSGWFGTGAAALGLSGSVAKTDFERVLEGKLPGQDARLGHERDGVWMHKAGWDLTFSAPKSVSVMAEVMGDARLIAAHDAAVRETLAALERDVAATRARVGGAVTAERTGSLVVALFRHDLNRNTDPQLHTHAVIANATQTSRGWRSLDSKPLYDAKMTAGQRYRQELALRVIALGYGIDVKPDGTFEIRGVDPAITAAFSTRRAEIEAKLADMGVPRGESNAKEAAFATLATRRSKGAVDFAAVSAAWADRLTATQRQSLADLREDALARAPTAAQSEAQADRGALAREVLAAAIEVMSEREAAFSKERLLAFAGRISLGRATDDDLKTELATILQRGDALARTVVEADRKARVDLEKEGLTTEKLRASERAMVAAEAAGRDTVRRLMSPHTAGRVVGAAEARSAQDGHAWTDDQRRATVAVLTSSNAVTAVQGLAGTAKTTTVLATYAAEARRLGKDVRALAPTASAAETLGAALGLRGKTVDRHLTELRTGKGTAIQNRWARAEQVWIVDEASMLSTAKMRALFTAAAAEQARIVLVGDVRQLGSVEAGAAFRQLQEAGMKTAVLEHIVRQSDPVLKAAVELAATGRAGAAAGYFDEERGNLIVEKDADARRDALAQRWLSLSPAERKGAILIDPSRQGRTRINQSIRGGLITEGTLGRDGAPAVRLETKGLTNAEKRFAFSYEPGDAVLFQRSYRIGKARLEANAFHMVTAVDQGAGVVTLRAASGQLIDWRPAEKGATRAEIYAVAASDLRVGDQILWTRNEPARGLRNGLEGVVTHVDPMAKAATFRFASGAELTIDTRRHDDGHWRYGYAQTAHSAQGRTAERVLIHAESHRINLVNAASFYVALSRAKEHGTLATDDLGKLRDALSGRAGVKATALDSAEAARIAAATPARNPAADARIAEAISETIRALRELVTARPDASRNAVRALDSAREAEPAATWQRQDGGARQGDARREVEAARGAGDGGRTLDDIKRMSEQARQNVAAAEKAARPSRGFER